MKLIGKTLNGKAGSVVLEESPLGKGGEGSVYSVKQHSVEGIPESGKLVAKTYFNPEEGDRHSKIKAMLKSPPDNDSVAWPLALVYNMDKTFAGYLMIKLPDEGFRTWAELSHVSKRKKTSKDFDVQYAITASRNLAVAMSSIHDAGHRVGDVNESNILVGSDARVMIVDTDSAQIVDEDGTLYPCLVGKPEYTAAEISHGSLKDHERTVETDMFGYSVAVFQMLTGGAHPTDGLYKGSDDPPSAIERIRSGSFPGIVDTPDYETVKRVPVGGIPLVFKKIFRKSLSPNPSERPGFASVIKAEDGVIANLKQCGAEKQHWYDAREKSCPWCANRKNNGSVDPWSMTPQKPKATQTSLQSVEFNNEDDGPVIRRAPAGSQPSRRGAVRQQSSGQPTPSSRRQPPPTTAPRSNPMPPPRGNVPLTRAAPEPEPDEPPKKVKGKTVLIKDDGSWEPRPSIRELWAFGQKKLALKCIENEIPIFAKCWYTLKSSSPHAIGTLIGLLMGLALSFAWTLIAPMIDSNVIQVQFLQVLVYTMLMGAGATSAIANLVLSLSAWINRRRAKKRGVVDIQKPWRTMMQHVFTSIIYGPFFVTLMLIGLLWLSLYVSIALLRGSAR